MTQYLPLSSNPHFFFFFFLVLPVYCYQPITLHPHAHRLSHVTPWTAARQAPLSMDFSRQEYCSGLPFPSPDPHFFMHQGPISWKNCFLEVGGGVLGGFGEDSSALHFLCPLLFLHQLHLRRSDIRSQRMKTPALPSLIEKRSESTKAQHQVK